MVIFGCNFCIMCEHTSLGSLEILRLRGIEDLGGMHSGVLVSADMWEGCAADQHCQCKKPPVLCTWVHVQTSRE